MENPEDNVIEFKRPISKKGALERSREQLARSSITLGTAATGSKNEIVTLSDEARTRHTILVGSSGTGKSTLMMKMITQIIEKKSSESVVLMDPHGDLYKEASERYYKHTNHKFLLIDLSKKSHDFRFNPLAYAAEDEWFAVSKIVNDILETFEHMYDLRVTGGPVFELYMRHVLLLLLNDKEMHTLSQVAKVFLDKSFRNMLMARCPQESIVNFWTNAERAKGDFDLANISAYITSKLNAFTTNPLVENIVDSKENSIDFNQLFRKPTALFVNFDKGILGNNDVRLLGTMLLNGIYRAAVREHGRGDDAIRCNIMLDEAHNFLTPSMIEMFPEARKFGINMLIAHQNLGQMEHRYIESSLDTLLGNVGNIIAFRVGSRDSYLLGDHFESVMSSRDLQNQPNFQAITRLLTEDGVMPPSRISINKSYPDQ